jgi:hypothetical protein
MYDPVALEVPIGEQNRHLVQAIKASQVTQIRLNKELSSQSMGMEHPTYGYRSRRSQSFLYELTLKFLGRHAS